MKAAARIQYPELYDAAGGISASAQRLYIVLILSEYAALFAAAVLALDLVESRLYYAIYAAVFLISAAILTFRSLIKPEQKWYRGRALAESIKTSCWRYMMRAEPFSQADRASAHRELISYLKEILETNEFLGNTKISIVDSNPDATRSMDDIRALPLTERKAIYKQERIFEQRSWYSRKAGWNKRQARIWLVVSLGVYAAAAISVLARIVYPDWHVWPTEPLIVVASCCLGWMQIKKFNELSSSYTLTAHEIGFLNEELESVTDDVSFSEQVNEAELAFSREHTQWVARQNSAG